MKKILIIGANGFTGRQILNDLSACKHYKVTGCSLHPDILPNNAEDYRFIETDIRNEADVKHLFEEVQPDVVINCSALVRAGLLRNASRRSLSYQCYRSGPTSRFMRRIQKPFHSFIYGLCFLMES